MTGKEENLETLGEALRLLSEQIERLSPSEQARFHDLVNNSGHDLKNSLGRIIGANALLIRLGEKTEGEEGETILEMTSIIRRAVKELDGQINEIIENLK